MIIGKTFIFEAAHYLPQHEKCGKTHGHTYKVTVEVEGKIQPNGMVMDLHRLKEMVETIIIQWDHSILNEDFEIPTCEYITEDIVSQMEVMCSVQNYNLYSVKVQEGEGGYAKWVKI